MKQLLALTGIYPTQPVRALNAAVAGLTAFILTLSVSVLLWGVALLRH